MVFISPPQRVTQENTINCPVTPRAMVLNLWVITTLGSHIRSYIYDIFITIHNSSKLQLWSSSKINFTVGVTTVWVNVLKGQSIRKAENLRGYNPMLTVLTWGQEPSGRTSRPAVHLTFNFFLLKSSSKVRKPQFIGIQSKLSTNHSLAVFTNTQFLSSHLRHQTYLFTRLELLHKVPTFCICGLNWNCSFTVAGN